MNTFPGHRNMTAPVKKPATAVSFASVSLLGLALGLALPLLRLRLLA
ncbi:hypothetical protein [Parasutterella muris]|uniref:Uncharacterized protein n=1 Tax=Parasutterella muris TaxID=2565572 RepID=A0A6L6YEE0_9BURK|nr:hypothetical protein [Parasutterella muris]MVX56000.1 hypothetical protein [Parasutterella muris]